jgi:hypothetical protein
MFVNHDPLSIPFFPDSSLSLYEFQFIAVFSFGEKMDNHRAVS